MKAIHIASFGGNIGDVLNHHGFYKTVCATVGIDEIEQVEVRRFYKNAAPDEKLTFSHAFLEKINQYDVLILGGGGFFDVRWDYSQTGTTLDFSQEFIDGIKIPVIVNAMGYHEYPSETTPENCSSFESFIRIIRDKGWFLSFRNDGSLSRFRRRFRDLESVQFISVPDNGFFAIDNVTIQPIKKSHENVIGLCITNDLFCKKYNGSLSIEIFNHQISSFITQIAEKNQVILFPHTPDDVEIIGHLFNNLPSACKRYKIIVAPYNPNGDSAIVELAKYYQLCDCIIGMRFHSLIMGLQLCKPTIALAGHQQIEDFFHEIGLSKYCIRLNTSTFTSQLLCLLQDSLESAVQERRDLIELNRNLKTQNIEYSKSIKKYLTSYSNKDEIL